MCDQCRREWLRDPEAFEQKLNQFVDRESRRFPNRAKRAFFRLRRFFRG